MLPDKIFGLTHLQLAALLIRLGLAFIFVYAAAASTITPQNWVGYLPTWVQILPAETLLKLFSVGEMVLAVWLLSGWRIFYAAAVSTALLLAITFTNLGVFDVTFRDLGLAAAALALLILSD